LKHQINFIANYKTFPIFRGFEQLSSLICWQGIAGQTLPWEGKSYFLCNFLFLWLQLC